MSSINDLIQDKSDESKSEPMKNSLDICDSELSKDPWEMDFPQSIPSYGPGSSMLDILPKGSPKQELIPEEYRKATDADLDARILAAKAKLGEDLLILGHFYQRDEIIKYADFVGDSFQLASIAKTKTRSDVIVFCGVHFMAETADILSKPEQKVILPNLSAGCSMADMANLSAVDKCWAQLEEVFREEKSQSLQPVIPVTYMNSAADLKAFCGRNGGIVCTSSNAKMVLEWAFSRGKRVLFFPDQHLGRNTAFSMGIKEDNISLWNPMKPYGGNSKEDLQKSQVILWHGFCSVHKRFNTSQIDKARLEHPGVRVIVHPECTAEVVAAADENGSTNYIVKAVAEADTNTTFAIGTEINLVNRLAKEYPQHNIFCLDPVICPCSTMYRIHPSYLAWVLENLVSGNYVNTITVDPGIAADAQIALERMLHVKPL